MPKKNISYAKKHYFKQSKIAVNAVTSIMPKLQTGFHVLSTMQVIDDSSGNPTVSRFEFKEDAFQTKSAVILVKILLPSCTKYKMSNRTCPYFNLNRAEWSEFGPF